MGHEGLRPGLRRRLSGGSDHQPDEGRWSRARVEIPVPRRERPVPVQQVGRGCRAEELYVPARPADRVRGRHDGGLVKQPLSVCVDAASWQFYYDGVIENDGGLICDTTSLDHAVQMVAHGTARDLFGSMMKVVVIRNSWTASWGLDGYVLLTRNGENTCGYRNAVLMVDV